MLVLDNSTVSLCTCYTISSRPSAYLSLSSLPLSSLSLYLSLSLSLSICLSLSLPPPALTHMYKMSTSNICRHVCFGTNTHVRDMQSAVIDKTLVIFTTVMCAVYSSSFLTSIIVMEGRQIFTRPSSFPVFLYFSEVTPFSDYTFPINWHNTSPVFASIIPSSSSHLIS